jgi:hypothetical protein
VRVISGVILNAQSTAASAEFGMVFGDVVVLFVPEGSYSALNMFSLEIDFPDEILESKSASGGSHLPCLGLPEGWRSRSKMSTNFGNPLLIITSGNVD